MKEQSVRVRKCHFEGSKERFDFDGQYYTPLYEKGIKETQNKPTETTDSNFCPDNPSPPSKIKPFFAIFDCS